MGGVQKQVISLQPRRVSDGALQVISRAPRKILLSQFPDHPIFHSLNIFQQQWAAEACSLKTPYCEVGGKLLSHLQNPQTLWLPAETFNDVSLLFRIEPAFDHIIADVHSAEQDGSLSLMDTATATNNGAEATSAHTILDCIQAVEDHTFSTKLHRHSSAFNVPISKNGIIKCCPKTPPKQVLTKMKLKPIGITSYD